MEHLHAVHRGGADLRSDSREQPHGKDIESESTCLIDMKMYVGNLPFSATQDDVQELFSQHGTVTDIHLPMDRETGRPRGFAFVTMSSKEEMDAAIKQLDGEDFQGRGLRVNEARPREEGGNRGGGGGYGGGGGGGRGGYGGGGGGGRGGYGGGGGGRGGRGRDNKRQGYGDDAGYR